MGTNIRSTRCLFMGKIIRSTIDFLYVKVNRFSAHKLPMIRPPSGTYYLTYNVTLRQLDSGCLGDDIFLWSKLNKVSINIDKTHCMSQVTSTKYLGINLDTFLNWKCHLAYLKNKLLKILWIIKNVSYFVNTPATIKLYYALFYPQLIY